MLLRKLLLLVLVVCCSKSIHGYSEWIRADGEQCTANVVKNYCDDCSKATFCSGTDVSTTECDDGNVCYTNGVVTTCVDASNVPECQCPTEVNTVIADPYDNQKYIVCFNGQGSVQSCENGKYFDPVTGDCVLTEPTATTIEPSEICEGAQGPVDAVAVSCTSYRICYSSGDYEPVVECDPGYLFDNKSKTCVKYEPFSCPNEDGFKYYADNHDCSLYYLCDSGEIFGQTLNCREGFEFDNSEETCLDDEVAVCDALEDCGICPDDQTAFGIDCERYYQCSENPEYSSTGRTDSSNLQYIPVVQECNPGFYFYPELGKCFSDVPGCP